MAEIQRLDRGNSFPPEKYYEACITYHILRYYEEKRIGRIFPFSISQIREKQKGMISAITWKIRSTSLFNTNVRIMDRRLGKSISVN